MEDKEKKPKRKIVPNKIKMPEQAPEKQGVGKSAGRLIAA